MLSGTIENRLLSPGAKLPLPAGRWTRLAERTGPDGAFVYLAEARPKRSAT